jgi:hypothetical protein
MRGLSIASRGSLLRVQAVSARRIARALTRGAKKFAHSKMTEIDGIVAGTFPARYRKES